MKRLETERLILRPWALTDAKDMFEYAQLEEVGPNAGWKPHKTLSESEDIIKIFIESDDVYAIVLKENNKVIGGLGLHDKTPFEELAHKKQKEVGYVLNPAYWGQGLVPEAVTRLKDFAFDELKIDLLWCAHYDFNHKSKRVNEKLGFDYYKTKEEVLEALDDKKVTTLYYTMGDRK